MIFALSLDASPPCHFHCPSGRVPSANIVTSCVGLGLLGLGLLGLGLGLIFSTSVACYKEGKVEGCVSCLARRRTAANRFSMALT